GAALGAGRRLRRARVRAVRGTGRQPLSGGLRVACLAADRGPGNPALRGHGPPPAARGATAVERRAVAHFDIGVQARKSPHSSVFTLSRATIASVAGVRARIAVTTYAPEPPERRLTVRRLRA